MTRNEPAVVLRGVTKRFGGRGVLVGIDAQVRAGAVVSLVGESGSGKTTLLRCLNVLTCIDAGQIQIAGHLITPSAPRPADLDKLRADVGMVFQDYQLFPHLSVLQNLCLAPQVVRKKTQAQAEGVARSLLERVGLGDRATCRPSELSGGQKQRVALARALSQESKVLLLDEPTSALDAGTRDGIVQLLRELSSARTARNPLTVVMVTHDLALAERLSDELWTLSEGTLAWVREANASLP